MTPLSEAITILERSGHRGRTWEVCAGAQKVAEATGDVSAVAERIARHLPDYPDNPWVVDAAHVLVAGAST